MGSSAPSNNNESMIHLRPLFLLGIILTHSTLSAEPVLVISLNGIAERIRAQNPDLAAARLRIDEALGRMNQSGRLSNPDFDTSIEHNSNFREARAEIGISQRFPVTDRLALEKSITVTQLKTAEAEILDVERKLIAQARLTVIEILALRQRITLLQSQSTLAESLAKQLTEASEKGEASKLDAGLAKLEISTLSVGIRQLEAAKTTAVGTLKPLLGMPPETPLHIDGTLPEPTLPNASTDPSNRPDLKAAYLEADAAGKGVTLEQARRYDDIEASIFTAAERSEDAPDGYDNEAIIGLRFRIPLPLWNNNEGNIQTARATQRRKELEASALNQNIRHEIDSALQQMHEWRKLIDELTNDLIPLVNKQTAIAENALRKGEGDIQTVFRTREKQLQLAAARLDALREFHLARIHHESAIGNP